MKLHLIAAAAGVAALLGAAPASAAIVFSFDPGGASPSGGFTVIDKFDDASGIVGSNFQIKVPPSDSDGAVPANSIPYGTSYLSVLGGGEASINFGGTVGAFEFDWGSIDSYNTLTVHGVSQDYVIIPGGNFPNDANGNQFLPGTNGLFTVKGLGGERFTGITLQSGTNSFEIDNLATGGVPEPAEWALMITGFGAAGAMLRRRRALAAAA